jgi:hypothetical protein
MSRVIVFTVYSSLSLNFWIQRNPCSSPYTVISRSTSASLVFRKCKTTRTELSLKRYIIIVNNHEFKSCRGGKSEINPCPSRS